MTADLFANDADMQCVPITQDAVLLRNFAVDEAEGLLSAVRDVIHAAPLRHMVTPGGYRMSVATSSCGVVGWVSDREGYRYASHDPVDGKPWPTLPERLRELAQRAAASAGFSGYQPDCCLINRYEPGAKLSLHQDRDERDLAAPIVSVSLGLPAEFLFGGLRRTDRSRRMTLWHGDVVVWGGAMRLAHHGVLPLADGEHPATGRCRINLTFRKALPEASA
jgi:alkylated DNA repair protein (DNA oxidative demethylase)